MSKEQELLLTDLCARIPYLVKVNITSRESKNRIVELTEDNICHLTNNWWIECKPYLFPLSSMTKKQKMELTTLKTYVSLNKNKEYLLFDWLNTHHFDYRGLIPLGLAIDCTNLNVY